MDSIKKLFNDKDFLISLAIGSFVGLIASNVTYNMWYDPYGARKLSLSTKLDYCNQLETLQKEEQHQKCMNDYYKSSNEIDSFAFIPSALFVFPLTTSTVAWFNYFRRKQHNK